ncbi:3-keto-5-aminohexanoate cleavage protein [Enterovibrio sp. ZSDZ35]|uniref:3-keto-5-aminohexanoate cleavage protein n=1 Tax=Enterovibrio qingdaonensis TaxID=2899818 RepID=A0ABT5QT79_9GAMM|nr:3-keto-5-aminohexanoate cleavage protein [Enterovibrio sp. ZSDZ35]MDD1783794.1 3-keto-5-aminohexanoate cleavage protein [Enterovibrio sp. ZSDZ35]
MQKGRNIIVAPNGARRGKEAHEELPLTLDEMSQCLTLCADAGAAMAHMHVRDKEGKHTLDVALNNEWLTEIRKQHDHDLVIQLTTEAVGQFKPHEQMELVRGTQPEAVSLALRELRPNASFERDASRFFYELLERKIYTQYILYDAADLSLYFQMLNDEKLPNRGHHLLLVLGKYKKGMLSAPTDLLNFDIKRISCEGISWATCAFGEDEHQCLAAAMSLGGDVRVGFENNLVNLMGQHAINNAELVQQLALLSQKMGLNINSAEDLRKNISRSFES